MSRAHFFLVTLAACCILASGCRKPQPAEKQQLNIAPPAEASAPAPAAPLQLAPPPETAAPTPTNAPQKLLLDKGPQNAPVLPFYTGKGPKPQLSNKGFTPEGSK